jgi:hypothetical protein
MAQVTATDAKFGAIVERFEARQLLVRARNITADDAARVLPHTIAGAALLSLLVVGVHRLVQLPSEFDLTVTSWALVTLLVVLAVAAGRRTAFAFPRRLDTRGFTAYILAIEAGILLVPCIVFSTVWRTRFSEMTGWTYPVVNKRWLVGLYVDSILTFVVFPLAADKLLRGWHAADDADGPTLRAPTRRWRAVSHLAGVAAALLIAWYFAGPPWHLDRHHRAIDAHEQVHLGPLQAIAKGYVPFIGPASTQYGPGSQVLTYAWMKTSRRFDVVSFREAQVGLHLVTFATVAVFAYLTVGFWPMLLILLVAIIYSPLTFFRPGADGTMVGSYGWGNALRYVGALLVVPSVVRIAHAARPRRAPYWPAVAAGAAWGFFSWVSQENLVTTFSATTVMLAVLWLTDTVDAKSIRATVVSVGCGFAVPWIAVFAYYALHGQLLAFVRNYFLVAGAVAMGFSNSWWSAHDSPGHLNAYYFTGPLLIALAVSTLFDVRTFSLRRPLDGTKARFLAFVSVALFCYQSVLYRSDSSHLINTMIALPFVLVLAVRDAPEWLVETMPARAAVRILLAALFIAVYPIGDIFADPYPMVIAAPLERFSAHFNDDPKVAKDGRAPFRRATRYLSDEPAAGPGMVPMRPFLEAASEIRDVIGTRRTFVDGAAAGAYSGLWYFILDLTPGPVLFDRETMVINNAIADEAFDHFQRHVREFDAVIAPALDSREVRAFLAAHPNAATIQRRIGNAPVYVLVSGAGS